jgi:hypothetical protein
MLTILPTIDVEGMHGRDPFNQMLLGKVSNGEFWGVYKIAKIFKEYGISATFFVDVYEYSFFGEDKLKDVCNKLLEFDQDVQLHTHPSWRDDSCDFNVIRKMKKNNSFLSQELDFMAKLNLDQQIMVLSKGVDLIKSWTGEKPIAHRSGGYSINSDTIKALNEVGILIDSSMNSIHGNSKITWSDNLIIEKNGIIELPVTFCKLAFGASFYKSKIIKIYEKKLKTDLDTLNLRALEDFVKISVDKNIKIMNLFMHSYSLIDYDYYYRKFKPGYKDEAKLIKIIENTLDNKSVKWASCKSFLKDYQSNKEQFKGVDFVPTIINNKNILSLAVNSLKNKYMHNFVNID